MLPSPGFSIPSIGTPLHQPEEDQMILPRAQQQQQQQQQTSSNALPVLLVTPQKTQYVSNAGFQTPHSLMQPQTPVS